MSASGPTKVQFRTALRRIGVLSPCIRKFLRGHFKATGRALTMRALARVAGYANYGGVNLQYGILARRIAEALGRRPPDPAVSLLVEFIAPPKVSNREYVLVMREEFASALKAERWV